MDNSALKSKFKHVPVEPDSRDRTIARLAAHNQTVQKEQAYWIEAILTLWYLWSQKPGRGNQVCKVKKIEGVALWVMVMVCGNKF